MRFDIRLQGSTASDRKCVMECTVYAVTHKELERQVEQSAQEGPWFYQDGGEAVAETEPITVLHVQRLVNGKWE
jgi:hypothetical protein